MGQSGSAAPDSYPYLGNLYPLGSLLVTATIESYCFVSMLFLCSLIFTAVSHKVRCQKNSMIKDPLYNMEYDLKGKLSHMLTDSKK